MDKEIISAIIGATGVIIAALINSSSKKDKNQSNAKKLTMNNFLLIAILCVSLLNSLFLLLGHEVSDGPGTDLPPQSSLANTEPLVPAETVLHSIPTVETIVNPTVDEVTRFTLGTIIEFGKYEQDDKDLNGAEAIEWIVLKQEGNEVLLVSALGLDTLPYHQGKGNSDWANSTIRQWLNGTFYNKAFSDEEKECILTKEIVQHKNKDYPACEQGENTIDCIFLLSAEEYTEYIYENGNIDTAYRNGTPSTCTRKKGVDLTNDKYCWWWLRTSSRDNETACSVTAYGALDYGYHDIHATKGMVRPAMWIIVE